MRKDSTSTLLDSDGHESINTDSTDLSLTHIDTLFRLDPEYQCYSFRRLFQLHIGTISRWHIMYLPPLIIWIDIPNGTLNMNFVFIHC